MDKAALRREIAAQVAALPPDYCRAADTAICQAVLASPLCQNAERVFCYAGTSREIDTFPLLRALLANGKALALPLCVGPGLMEARLIRSLDELLPGKYGILAPGPQCPLVPPEKLRLALVPCCTGNAFGQRLGYGGGFYDRFLGSVRCPKILLCRERLVRQDIPLEPHDLLMDYLVTENGMVRVRRI